MADESQTPAAPVAYASAPKCPQCADCGFVDKQEQQPWSRFAGKYVAGIHTGEIEVMSCPKCKAPKK